MSIASTSRGVCCHWNGPALGLTSCDGSRCARVVANIRSYHLNNGWNAIAYNFLICPGCGTVRQGRGWGARSGANGTTAANREWHAAMVMSGRGEPFTDVAKRRLHELNDEHELRFGRSRLTYHLAVRGGGTECAGTVINSWVRAGARLEGGNIVSWRDRAQQFAIRMGISDGSRRRDYLERVEAWAMFQSYEEGTPVPSWARDLVAEAEAAGTIQRGTGAKVMRRYDWLALRGRR